MLSGGACRRAIIRGLIIVAVIIVIERILLPRAPVFYLQSLQDPWTPPPRSSPKTSGCTELERNWCDIVGRYARDPSTPPVEIVFNNPDTWFDNEPPVFWSPRLSRISSYKTVPNCNIPCRFLSKASETTTRWFEFCVDAESWALPPPKPNKIGNIRLAMEAWSVDKGVSDDAFTVAATIHLRNDPPRLPLTYPDFPRSELYRSTPSFAERSQGDRALVALFLRHCGVDHRDDFLKQLISEMKIDSFGGCFHSRRVSLECSFKSYWEEKVCELRHYKFVIGIENTFQADYVTEKLFHVFWAGAIPIYWGGPNARDFLPEHSTIYIPDYTSVRALVHHIKEVGSNETLYNSYHAWRTKPLSPKLDFVFNYSRAEGICNICKRAAVALFNHTSETTTLQ